eukprot:scaffold676_cov115-Isochrysis_galbana.AAC.10
MLKAALLLHSSAKQEGDGVAGHMASLAEAEHEGLLEAKPGLEFGANGRVGTPLTRRHRGGRRASFARTRVRGLGRSCGKSCAGTHRPLTRTYYVRRVLPPNGARCATARSSLCGAKSEMIAREGTTNAPRPEARGNTGA